MSTNNNIKVTELDYNAIRDNLKTFLQGQDKFSDYNFEGSGLAVLLDVLAYNTHYNALYTNMAINEMFLDSASKRNSIVSIANNYGYLPQSAKTSKAILTITLTPNATGDLPPTASLPAYSPFNTIVDGVPYVFYTIEDYSAILDGGEYVFDNVMVYQGEPQNVFFACTEKNQRFVFPNTNIDTDTLIVTVQPTREKPEYTRYELARNVIDINSQSEIFFLKELENRYYELSFGINGLGVEIIPGNLVNTKYLITQKDLANGASVFAYGGVGLGGSVTAITKVKSYGGKQEESKEEIKVNVSQTFFDQNRAVTAKDYASIIKRFYDNADSINVWGGEDASPPQYGKVFVAIKPTNGPYLSTSEKAFIKNNILKSKGIVSIIPEIVDPIYSELDMDVTVYYNRSKTSRTADQLKRLVIDTINEYNNTTLQKFDGAFRYSKFSAAIDSIDQGITSNIVNFRVFNEIIPLFNSAAQYKLDLVNPIYTEIDPENSFTTTGFYIDNTDSVYYLDDDGKGNIRLFTIIKETGEKSIRNASIGRIDYAKGSIVVNGLRITSLLEPAFYFMVKTASYDVISVRNQIVTIPPERVRVNLIDDSSASIGFGNSVRYQFTPSR